MQQKNRREKSLGLLCKKFLEFYPHQISDADHILISLDDIAHRLDVERRRIYDIVNVLESIEVLSRSCKNKYIWHGFNSILDTLVKLKTLAVKSNFLEYTKALMASQLDLNYDLHNDQQQATNVYFEPSFQSTNQLSSQPSNIETKDCSTQTINISREEKSLGIMSQKFLMLFLTSEDGIVSINFAARVLLGDSKNDITEHGRFKTKIRRLYDIANVLSSVGLIKKYSYTHSTISKPAYKYIGPTVEINRDAEYVYNFMNQGNPLSNSKHSLFDHFKRNLDLKCNIPKFDINTGILKSKTKDWTSVKKSEKQTTATDRIQNTDIVNNQSTSNTTDNANTNEDNFYQHDACQSTSINNDLELAQPILTAVSFNQQYHYHSDLNYQYAHTYSNNNNNPNSYSSTAYNSSNENHLISCSSSSLCCAYNQPNHYYFDYSYTNYSNPTDYLYNDTSLITKSIKQEQIDHYANDDLNCANDLFNQNVLSLYDHRQIDDSDYSRAEKRRKTSHHSQPIATPLPFANQIDHNDSDSLNSVASSLSSASQASNQIYSSSSASLQQYYENSQQLPSINTVLN